MMNHQGELRPYNNQSHHPSSSNMHQSTTSLAQLGYFPAAFIPRNWDVICQRGRENYEHIGNRRFRICIENNLSNYVKAKSRQEKSQIVCSIVEGVKAKSSGAGFIKKDLFANRWFEVGDKMARDKVGQALRDAMKIQRIKKGDSPRVGGALRKRTAGKAGNLIIERHFQVRSHMTIDSSRRSRADSFNDSISDSGDSQWPQMALPSAPLQPIFPPRESSYDLSSLLTSNPPSCLMPPPLPIYNAVHIPAALGREPMYAPHAGVREDARLSVPYLSLWTDHDLLPNPVAFPAGGLQKKESLKLLEDELNFLHAK